MPITVAGAMLGGSIIQGAMGLGQTILGGVQRRKAKRGLENLKMPTYEIPDSIGQMVDIARRRSQSDMPGLGTMLSEQSSRTTAGVQASALAASSQSDLAAATRNLYAEEMRGARQLGMMSAEYRSNMEQQYMNTLGQQAQFEDRAFQINQMMPYEQKVQRYMSDLGVSGANIGAGIGNMVGAGTSYAGNMATLGAYGADLNQEIDFGFRKKTQKTPNPFQLDMMGNMLRQFP